MNLNDYIKKLQDRKNLSGKKAIDDPQLIMDLQQALGYIFPHLVISDMEYSIEWLVGWITYVNDKNGRQGKYLSYDFKDDRGRIVIVNLFGHMGNELTWTHPAIILANGFNWVLVAPISSTIYGDEEPLHVDLDPTPGGVDEKCGAKLEDMRVISKNQIISKKGKVISGQLDSIDLKIVEYFIPKTHSKINENLSKLRELEDEIMKRDEKIRDLEKKLRSLKEINPDNSKK